MPEEHPARRAGLLSQRYIAAGERDKWLDLFAGDAVVQDPVGVSPLDPTGKGQVGKEGIAAFYDNVISKGRVSFNYPKSYAAGDECAFIGSVTNTFADGKRFSAEGVFVYRVNAEGKLLSLRAFWEFGRPSTEGLEPHPPVGE
jgi:ketosteroid isomerase-like protein